MADRSARALPRLLVLGNANVDLVLGEIDGWPAVGTEVVVERSEMRPGGSAGNAALALAGMGVPHRYIAASGDDANGAWLRDAFDAASTEWIVGHGPTTLTVGIVHRGGDRAFLTTPGHLQTAGLDAMLDRLPAAPAGRAVALIAGGFLMPALRDGTARLIAALAARGWSAAIDPGWPPEGWTADNRARMADWLAVADMALVNAEEAVGWSGRAGREAAAGAMAAAMRPDAVLVVKDGAAGAFLRAGARRARAAAPRVRVIDTVGAGDTFNAAFLAAWAQGADLDDALLAGVTTAARAISTYPRRYSG